MDRFYPWILRALGLIVPGLVIALGWQLYQGSAASRHAFGWGFVVGSSWDPVFNHFGALPFIFGTLVTTAVAIVLAAPLGIGAAIFLAELAPNWLRGPVGYLVELLAAVPSVVYGLWGLFALVPWMRTILEPWLIAHSDNLALFRGAPYGLGFLAAGLVLAIMVIPFVVGLAREAIASVPRVHREAAYALGATKWEAIWQVVLPGARSGIAGGVMLGIGRALGETIAVTMLIGNTPTVSASLLAPGYTLASVIANEFTEATTAIYTSALVEIGLVLFAITLVVNLIARLMVARFAGAGAAA
ncbi:MAG TPA: phosphate ABC transporter permease subunit PstC [Terriglobales bacterium]|nr:phosphate ABC transporter permease subunit PstC [Terriglobales bacterium]